MTGDAIILDLDGTLTLDDQAVPYPERAENPAVVAAAAAAAAAGYRLEIATARGMRSYGGDRALVERHVRPQVETWLGRKGIACDALHVAKPWCGPRGFYVDDRNLHVEEFAFRFGGPFSRLSVVVMVEAVADADLAGLHQRLQRLERWLNVGAYFYLDLASEGGAPFPPVDRLARRVATAEAGAALEWTADAALLVAAGPGRIDPALYFTLHHEWLQQHRPAAVLAPPIPLAGGSATAPFALVPAAQARSLLADAAQSLTGAVGAALARPLEADSCLR